METTHHVNSSANEDAVVERPEEGDKETNKARDEIDPCKIVYLKSKELAPRSLTFAVPYRVDDVVLDAEDHRGHDHCCKNGLSGGSKVQEMEIEGGFEDLGDEGAIIDGKSKHTNIMEYKYKYTNTKYDLGYEGAVLHETGKTDHHQSSREQSSRLSLHAAGAVDRRPDVFA